MRKNKAHGNSERGQQETWETIVRIGRTLTNLGVTGHRGRAKNNFVTSPELAVPSRNSMSGGHRRRGKPGSELAVPLANS